MVCLAGWSTNVSLAWLTKAMIGRRIQLSQTILRVELQLLGLVVVVLCLWLCRCCVVGVRRFRLCWVRLLGCGFVGSMLVGVLCLRVLVLGVWGCRRMRFSVSGFGLMVLGGVVVMRGLLGLFLRIIRCWVRLLRWLVSGVWF